MKMILKLSSVCLFTFLLISCKQDETAQLSDAETKNPGNLQTGRVMEDCFYTKLTETSPGVWEASFSGTTVKFTGLHIRNDGRLYGRLLSAENHNILTGGDGYNQRDFAFERVVCSGGGGVTKTTQTLSYTQFMSNSGGNSSYAYYGGTFSSGTAFTLWAQANLASGITYAVSTGTYQETRYQWDTPMNCTSTQVVIGKLVAKGVTRPPGGQFSWTEFGVANMCFPDPMVIMSDE